MIKRYELLELLDAVITMRSLQKDYDSYFRGKASKIIAEEKVDRLVYKIKKELQEEEETQIKNFAQDLF